MSACATRRLSSLCSSSESQIERSECSRWSIERWTQPTLAIRWPVVARLDGTPRELKQGYMAAMSRDTIMVLEHSLEEFKLRELKWQETNLPGPAQTRPSVTLSRGSWSKCWLDMCASCGSRRPSRESCKTLERGKDTYLSKILRSVQPVVHVGCTRRNWRGPLDPRTRIRRSALTQVLSERN